MPKNDPPPGYLKRLPDCYYQHAAWVHWVMTIDGRRCWWLDALMHAQIREAMLQTFARYQLICPVYCLMPDHAHFVWCGCAARSDQRKASAFFRRNWNVLLERRGRELQKQGFDHVLVETERNSDALEDTCEYVMKNPARAELTQCWQDWDYSGSLAPGYPRLHPQEDRFWPRFWTAYNSLREPGML